MMLRGHTGAWALFFLAAVFPGVHLQLPSEAQIYQPVLQPSEAAPPIGTYMLKNLVGEPCIKATMGAEYIVFEKKKTWYYNLDPSRVRTAGYCGKEAAVLSLTLPGNVTSLQFTFRKEKDFFYVKKLTAHVSPLPVCQGCASKTYSGLLARDELFAAADGKSFKCKSGNLLLMSSELSVALVPLQLQAFTLPGGQFGEEVECPADYNKRVVPIIFGAVVVGLVLTAVLTFLLIRDGRRGGYERL